MSTSVLLISTSVLLISAPVLLMSTSVLLISTSVLLISATALLISTSILLLVLRHSCCVGSHVLIGTMVPQYCIVPLGTYCVASYSFLMIGPSSQTVI